MLKCMVGEIDAEDRRVIDVTDELDEACLFADVWIFFVDGSKDVVKVTLRVVKVGPDVPDVILDDCLAIVEVEKAEDFS